MPFALLDRACDCHALALRASSDRDDRFLRAECSRRRNCAVEDEVREVAKQHLVLVTDRLAFERVHNHDGASALICDRAKLAPCREPGAAAAGQSALLDQRDQFVALPWEALEDRRIASKVV